MTMPEPCFDDRKMSYMRSRRVRHLRSPPHCWQPTYSIATRNEPSVRTMMKACVCLIMKLHTSAYQRVEPNGPRNVDRWIWNVGRADTEDPSQNADAVPARWREVLTVLGRQCDVIASSLELSMRHEVSLTRSRPRPGRVKDGKLKKSVQHHDADAHRDSGSGSHSLA